MPRRNRNREKKNRRRPRSKTGRSADKKMPAELRKPRKR